MATKVYDLEYIQLFDGTQIEVTPLKIKYMRQFMEAFEPMKEARGDLEALEIIVKCATIAMQQYMPSLATEEQVEDSLDLGQIYKLLEISAGIKINEKSEKSVVDQGKNQEGKWEDLDLAKLEAEIFLLGIWKDFDELESSISMPELVAIIGQKRDLDYNERKFLAALQGVDLDNASNKSTGNEWEELKARVFSKGKARDANDIVSYQGSKAEKAGFGIGLGLSYTDMTS